MVFIEEFTNKDSNLKDGVNQSMRIVNTQKLMTLEEKEWRERASKLVAADGKVTAD